MLYRNIVDSLLSSFDLIIVEEFQNLLIHASNDALIDDYWSEEKTNLKKRLADEYGIGFISLEEIHTDHKKYDAGMGSVVYGSEGEEHVIDSEGTAMHPGDVGMAYIAGKLEEYIIR